MERRKSIPPNQQEHFCLAIEAAPNGMLMADAAGTILLVNAPIETLFGYARAELIGQPVELLVPVRFSSSHPQLRSAFMSAPRTRAMAAGRELYGLRKDGTEVPIEICLNPLETPNGSYVLSSIVDITERNRADEQLRASLREKEALLKEIHHRVKNNLQVVSSLLSLQANYVDDEGTRTALAQSQARIHSIALVHEKLYQGVDVTRMVFTDYIRDVVNHLAHAHAIERRAIRCVVYDSELTLPTDECIACGLIVNELVTNSIKHAFPAKRGGLVEVKLTKPNGRTELSVRDDGIGLPVGVDLIRTRTLGLDLVSAFTRRLKGDLSVTREPGTTFCLKFSGG
jgi:two-component system, sensor histidine kinase PdtaS